MSIEANAGLYKQAFDLCRPEGTLVDVVGLLRFPFTDPNSKITSDEAELRSCCFDGNIAVIILRLLLNGGIVLYEIDSEIREEHVIIAPQEADAILIPGYLSEEAINNYSSVRQQIEAGLITQSHAEMLQTAHAKQTTAALARVANGEVEAKYDT